MIKLLISRHITPSNAGLSLAGGSTRDTNHDVSTLTISHNTHAGNQGEHTFSAASSGFRKCPQQGKGKGNVLWKLRA